MQYVEDTGQLISESLTLQIHYGGARQFAEYVKAMRTDLGLNPKSVAGIGAKAHYAKGQLVVLHGRHFIIVIVGSNRPDAERLKAATAVAKKVLPRLAKV